MFYNRPNLGSFVGVGPSIRDQSEAKLFAQAVKQKLLIFGICRGAQLGCALSGGLIVQDVQGHNNSHRIVTNDGKTLLSSSIHHQMMYPWEVEHRLIAWSIRPLSADYRGLSEAEIRKWPTREYGENEKRMDVIEPEIVWFPTTKCLAIQGHPEMQSDTCDFNRYLKTLTHEYYHHQ